MAFEFLLSVGKGCGVTLVAANLQVGNRLGTDTDFVAVVSDGVPDLVDAALEAAGSADADVLVGRAGGPEVVCLVVILAKHVVIGYAEDLVAGVAVLVDVLVEIKPDAALAVQILHLGGSNGHTEQGREMATSMGGGVVPADGGEKGQTRQLDRNTFAPLYVGVVDAVCGEKRENAFRDVGGVDRGVQGGIDRHPDDGGT